MTITVNGKPLELPAATTVAALLATRGLDPARVVVELNREILPRDRFAATALSDGDVLEIVQFVGGG